MEEIPSADLQRFDTDDGRNMREHVISLLKLEAREYTTPEAFFERFRYFFVLSSEDLQKSRPQKRSDVDEGEVAIATMVQGLEELSTDQWNASELKDKIGTVVERIREKSTPQTYQSNTDQLQNAKTMTAAIMHAMRWALLASPRGPPMGNTMELLGRNVTLQRLRVAKSILQQARESGTQDLPPTA